MFFDWFYPDYFQIINRSLSAYFDDDTLVLTTFKFLKELALNRCHRLRFDTWSISGLIVFKETSLILIQFLDYTDCLKNPVIFIERY